MLRLMCITAHPDDEAGGFGGTLRLYHDRGVETCVVCLTPGQAASNRGNAANDQELAAMRRQEFAAACEILGIATGIVLDYPDGQLYRQDLYKVVCELTLHIRRFRPQVLITFGPDGSVTGHIDHSMASVFATLAFHWAGRTNRYPDQTGWRNYCAPNAEALLRHGGFQSTGPATSYAAPCDRNYRNRQLPGDKSRGIPRPYHASAVVAAIRISRTSARSEGNVSSRRKNYAGIDRAGNRFIRWN